MSEHRYFPFITEEKEKELLQQLLEDVVARYFNVEYWDYEIIKTYVADNRKLVGYCTYCDAEVYDMFWDEWSGGFHGKYCTECYTDLGDCDVSPKRTVTDADEIAAQRADIANDEKKLGF